MPHYWMHSRREAISTKTDKTHERTRYPTPTTGAAQRGKGCATEPLRDRSRAYANGGQAEPERGTGDATGGTGGAWDEVSQGNSRTGCAGVILVRGIGGAGADRTADGESHAERPGQAQHPQRVTARQQTQTGRREPQRAAQGTNVSPYRLECVPKRRRMCPPISYICVPVFMPNVGIHYAQIWGHIFVDFAILQCGYTFAKIGADEARRNRVTRERAKPRQRGRADNAK